jgi:hypothetical protein
MFSELMWRTVPKMGRESPASRRRQAAAKPLTSVAKHLARCYLKENYLSLSSAVWPLDTTSLSLFTPRSEEVPTHEIQAIRLRIGR